MTQISDSNGKWDFAGMNQPPLFSACGKPEKSFIPRLGMCFACVLSKGHFGHCQPGGECFTHGRYVGDKCPKWPQCEKELLERQSPKTVEWNPLCLGTPGCSTLKEIIRLLMHQVREEQALRAAMLKVVAVQETEPVPVPTDSEVDSRISELQEIAKKGLTKLAEGGNIEPQVG